MKSTANSIATLCASIKGIAVHSGILIKSTAAAAASNPTANPNNLKARLLKTNVNLSSRMLRDIHEGLRYYNLLSAANEL